MIAQMPPVQTDMLTQQALQPVNGDTEAAMSELMQNLIDSGYSEAEIAEIMELTQYQLQQDAMTQQIEQAQTQANTGAPPGMQGPRLYTAASPLAHVANTIEAYRGRQALPELQNQQQALMDQRTNTLMMLLRGQ